MQSALKGRKLARAQGEWNATETTTTVSSVNSVKACTITTSTRLGSYCTTAQTAVTPGLPFKPTYSRSRGTQLLSESNESAKCTLATRTHTKKDTYTSASVVHMKGFAHMPDCRSLDA